MLKKFLGAKIVAISFTQYSAYEDFSEFPCCTGGAPCAVRALCEKSAIFHYQVPEDPLVYFHVSLNPKGGDSAGPRTPTTPPPPKGPPADS